MEYDEYSKNMSSKDSFDKLKGHSDIKQDINRRNGESQW